MVRLIWTGTSEGSEWFNSFGQELWLMYLDWFQGCVVSLWLGRLDVNTSCSVHGIKDTP